MLDIKPTTLFTKKPSIVNQENELESEGKKISYWLEKLYYQEEARIKFEKENAQHVNGKSETPKATAFYPVRLQKKQ